MIMKHIFSFLALFGASLSGQVLAQHTFDVQTARPGAPIQSTMYGIFFEDINYGADGGLYAEMVKNRSFEFENPWTGWNITGKVELKDDGPFERNPHYVRLNYSGHRVKHTSIENTGFFGVSVRKDEVYKFSVWARVPEGQGDKAWITVQICDPALDLNQHKLCSARIEVVGHEWKKYEADLTPFATCEEGTLRIFLRNAKFGKPGSADDCNSIDLEHVSLFPAKTWKDRPGGMRQDLAQALYDLHPGIFRFPGGCIVEGTDLTDRYQWKNTVGPVENRPLNLNRWQYEFDYRFYPDYYQSYGLGFYEYFQLCEDFGADALPVLNCGMTCQYENNIKDEAIYHVAVEDLDPYIQDAVDLVEFANGDASTTWGKVRADMGHLEPFGLKFLAIGNEQWDYKDNPAYTSRLRRFVEVLRKKCPEIKIIGTTGPNSEGWDFDLLQPRMKELGVDLYDEHFYRDEQWFLSHGLRYDSYDRKGPKVFAGEYACHGKGKYDDGREKKRNHFETSLYEAAFLTGIERNADVVHMATYAPLFAHIKGWQWRPDLIWFDNMRSFRSISYYVQQLYGHYKGSRVLPLTMQGKPVAGQEGQDGLFASAVVDEEAGMVIVKVANTSDQPQSISLNLLNKKKTVQFASAQVITLHSDDLDAENTLDQPFAVVPVTSDLDASTRDIVIGAKTFQVYLFKK